MDSIIVGIIILFAAVFSVRSIIKLYKGEGCCSCKQGCSCSSREKCNFDFSVKDNKLI